MKTLPLALRHPVSRERLGEVPADRPGARPEHQPSADDEPGVVVDPGEERCRTRRPPCQDGRLEILRIEDITNDPIAAIFVGRDHGANVSFFIVSCGRGQGPQPHRHPYEETFVVLEGRSAFWVGEETFDVEAGSIVVAPAGVVHSFKGAVDGVTRQVNIHPVAEMVTEWVDET